MIIALPFDLRLWTGIDSDTVSEEEAFFRFVERRDRVREFNQHLSKGAIQNCRLYVPLTQRLYEQLSNTPPWSEVRKGSFPHRLKSVVLASLRNKRITRITLVVDVEHVVHLHTWQEPDGFFPSSLIPMKDAWVEMVGVCAFEGAVSAREFEHPLPILETCVITAFSGASEARIVRSPLADMTVEEERHLRLLFQSDAWTWKRWVRRVIWADERLPLGPIGYTPPTDWQLGNRPRRYRGAYRDSLGGLWEWESGRASDDHNPFGGHWNVQLPDASVKHRWVNWIEERTGREISTRPDLISHINVEPDGRIADRTFDWQE